MRSPKSTHIFVECQVCTRSSVHIFVNWVDGSAPLDLYPCRMPKAQGTTDLHPCRMPGLKAGGISRGREVRSEVSDFEYGWMWGGVRGRNSSFTPTKGLGRAWQDGLTAQRAASDRAN